MADEVIDRLVIAIESNIEDLAEGTEKGISTLEKRLKTMGREAESAFDKADKALDKVNKQLKESAEEAEAVKKALELVGKSGKFSVEQVSAEARELDKALKLLGRTGQFEINKIEKGATGLGQVFGKLQTLVAGFIALFAVNQVIDFFKQIGSAAIQTNAQFETFRTQFETLLGSASAARSRLEELARFGVETPFELSEITEASRVLQVFGGTTLATGDNLRMIGDIAAGVNQPFKDVAFWIGRMFDALKSGRPFGEAALRLQEMGALSGDVRAQMEAMQKSGKSGAEIFEFFSEKVGGKFAGNMERLAGTFQGVVSNLEDFRTNLLRIGGEPLFDEVSGSAKEFLDIISEDEMSEALINLAKAAGEAAAGITNLATTGFFETLEDVEAETVDNLAEALRDAAAAITEFLDLPLAANLNGVIEATTIVIDEFTAITNTMNRVKSVVQTVSPLWEAIKDVFFAILYPLRNVIKAFGQLSEIVEQVSGYKLVDFTRELAEESQTAAQATEDQLKKQRQLTAAYAEYADARKASAEAAAAETEATAPETDPEKLKELLLDNFSDLTDLQNDLNEKTQELETGHQEKMVEITEEFGEKRAEAVEDAVKEAAEIERDFAKKRAEAAQDLERDLAKLDEDTAEKRSDIIKKTREDLAKVEANSDEQLADERQKFDREERRETEDHLKDMRRLREQYLFDLEDAVKSRDARAIVDLQRRFQMEQSERSEDFETTQRREREDKDIRLQEIREQERERSAEILRARDEELRQLAENDTKRRSELRTNYEMEIADLRQAESEKRAELEVKLGEELTALRESEAEKLTAEQESYAARLAELDAAFTERLTKLAEKLAEEKDINEEGAKQILGTLAEYFGKGQKIDQLMSAFRERMQARVKIQAEFEGFGEQESSSPGPRSGHGGGSIRAFARGGSMIAKPPGQLALFGEKVPEIAQFTPIDQMQDSFGAMQNREITLRVEMSGSAPPGIRNSQDRDQIAAVFVDALRQAGMKVN